MTRCLPILFLVALLTGSARAQTPPPAPDSGAKPYWSASALRADVAAVGPNPFLWAREPAVRAAPPARPAGPVPSNVAHLALWRPYTVAMDAAEAPDGFARVLPASEAAVGITAVYRLAVTPRNPFDPASAAPTMPSPVPKELAGDTYQAWTVTVKGSAWEALEAAWAKDPVTVRRLFRTETKQDWPVTTLTGPRAEANRLAAARWVRRTWDAAVRTSVNNLKRTLALRGPVMVSGPIDAPVSFLAGGDAASHFEPSLGETLRVTGDRFVDRYGVGFLVRLAADLGQRIPWPALDLSRVTPAEAPWAVHWLDEAVRNGVQGLTVTPPADATAWARVLDALEPLRVPNTYLPPPSEVGLLVSRDTGALEPGAWVALFRAYAALRERGVWPNFVSDEQVVSGSVALARFKVLVVPAAKWADRTLMDEVSSWAERGGTVVVSDPLAFSRALDGWDTSARARSFLGWAFAEPPADFAGPTRIVADRGVRVLRTDGAAPLVTERTAGLGRVVAFARPLDPAHAPEPAFWAGLLKSAGVPSRTWIGNVTTANVKRVSGTYSRPAALK